ncbi:MAG: T9SS C-terminal target domain-containing protein [Ignavibacteriales bacterium]|nr:MAG: T9SS C-terminal target domain-containing protein [Ignavibacteriales bacterium]
MKKLLLSLILFFSNICISQWHYQSSAPPAFISLNKVYFINNETGVIIGEDGNIFKTTNAGIEWKNIPITTSNKLNDIHFYNDKYGIIAGSRSPSGDEFPRVLMTTDGGETWKEKYHNTKSGYTSFKGAFMLDSLTAFIVGDKAFPTFPKPDYEKGIIFKTTDGGETWVSKLNAQNNISIYGIYFTNNHIGIICTEEGTIYRSIDRGENWDSVKNYGKPLRSVSFRDSLNGVIVGGWYKDPIIIKSNDGGNDWSTSDISTNEALIDVEFFNSKLAIAVGSNKSVYKSSDNGNTWSQLLFLGEGVSNSFNGISISDTNTITIVGIDGQVLRSVNAGNDWHSLIRGHRFSLNSVHFLDIDFGIAVGVNSTILKTIDRGLNWTKQNSGESQSYWFNDIDLYDNSVGLAVGESGVVLKTIDGGNNWKKLNVSTDSWLTAVDLYYPDIGIISGFNGTLLKTSDSGNNWIKVNSNTDKNLLDVCFLDSLNLIAVGDSGTIIRSTDGGLNWQENNIVSKEQIISVCRLNNQSAMLAGEDQLLIKTTDKGNSWEKLVAGFGPGVSITDVSFIDSLRGFLITNSGFICRTNDGGISWTREYKSISLTAICMIDSTNAVAVGPGGTILSNIQSNVSLNDEKIEAKDFRLNQNYPNPFNPVTYISYSLSNNSFVQLRIYDLLGKEVDVIVNQEQTPGNYKVLWKPKGLTSGIYFYRLQTDNFFFIKKMVYLK